MNNIFILGTPRGNIWKSTPEVNCTLLTNYNKIEKYIRQKHTGSGFFSFWENRKKVMY